MRFSTIRSVEDMTLLDPNDNSSVVQRGPDLGARDCEEDISRFRNSGPKSRSGCITCKIRRVKCGEEKPACTRCSSTGRTCDGYAPPKPRRNSKTKSKLQPVQKPSFPNGNNETPGNPVVVPRSPSIDIQGSLSERRSFHYFRSRNMSSMPGNFEPYFWDHLVLQFSHRDSTIRYSLIALSAIYEEHEARPSETRISAGHSRSLYVLQQYTKALRHLADSLLTGQADPRVTLISCLIFIWIEILQNNLESGFKHLESGLRILKDLGQCAQSGGRCSSYERDFEDIYGSLDRSFKRLSTQAMIHGQVSSSPETSLRTHPWGTEDPVPPVFGNLFEARNCLDGMLNAISVYIRQIRDSDKYGTADQVPDLLLIDSICENFLGRLAEWQVAMRKMLATHFGELEKDGQNPAVTYLELYHSYLTIILRTPFATSEMVFDGYTAEFARIVELADQLLDRSSNEEMPVLSFDMGIMPPLFLLVLKCRDIQLRRKALALLKRSPEQEGLWRRAAVVAHSEWKIDFEERGRGDLPESSPLPESARIYQERLSYGIRDGKRVPTLIFRRSSVSLTESAEEIEMSEKMKLAMDMGNMV